MTQLYQIVQLPSGWAALWPEGHPCSGAIIPARHTRYETLSGFPSRRDCQAAYNAAYPPVFARRAAA